MANKQRGEVTIEGPGGENFTLCLTLGAVAEIEDELEMNSLSDIDVVMEKGKISHVMVILVALLHGGGHTNMTVQDLMTWDVNLRVLMQKIQDCFVNSGFVEDLESTNKEAPVTAEGEAPSGN